VTLLPEDTERRLYRWASGYGAARRWIAKAVAIPALAASGVRTAISLVRARATSRSAWSGGVVGV